MVGVAARDVDTPMSTVVNNGFERHWFSGRWNVSISDGLDYSHYLLESPLRHQSLVLEPNLTHNLPSYVPYIFVQYIGLSLITPPRTIDGSCMTYRTYYIQYSSSLNWNLWALRALQLILDLTLNHGTQGLPTRQALRC